MESRKPRVLVLTSYFSPGFRAGGPIRSITNLIEALASEMDFFVMTRDRDLGASAPYDGIEPDVWTTHGRVKVLYSGGGRLSLVHLRAALAAVIPDRLYLNSLFDPAFTIRPLLWRRFGLIAAIPVIIAPRGELFSGALAIKPAKKRLYLGVARFLRLYQGVHWQASSSEERAAICQQFGGDARVTVASNLPSPATACYAARAHSKRAGHARFVYVGRIARNKNIRGAIEHFSTIAAPVDFVIYGSREDPAYWRECELEIAKLPGNIKMSYGGELAPSAVPEALAKFDFFLSLTHGENYGHAIVEALLAGLPVLISDRTPWRDLKSARAGWDVALEAGQAVTAAIEQCIAMPPDEYAEWSSAAVAYASRRVRLPGHLDDSRQLFL
jgi:glycosyltransferase involved in cell wall biosynthesis